MKSARFKSHELEEMFNQACFVHIRSIIGTQELEDLREVFQEVYNYNGEEQGMWNSLYNIGFERASAVSNKILNVLQSELSDSFYGYKVPVATIMVKNPNRNGITDLHRDYSSQDEDEFQYRNIWIPLVDTALENGGLYALKFSHTFFDYPLPMFCKWPYSEYHDLLFKGCNIIDAKQETWWYMPTELCMAPSLIKPPLRARSCILVCCILMQNCVIIILTKTSIK